jgi:hypothetical protein
MSLITNQILINNLGLPKEISLLVKDYVYRRINKIPKSDSRYEMLLHIPKINLLFSSSVVDLLFSSSVVDVCIDLILTPNKKYSLYCYDYHDCYIIGIIMITHTAIRPLCNRLMSVRVDK